jgi:hypothetical protein
MVVLRHLIGTPHRKALLPQIDKLFNEQILLGSGVGSRETLRYEIRFYSLSRQLTYASKTVSICCHR